MNIVITGCSQGIGREIALLFGKERDNKIVGITRNKKALDEIVRILSPEIFKGIQYDINSIFNNSQPLLNDIKKHFNVVDILINNAGRLVNKKFIDSEIEEGRSTFETNFFAPSELIRLLVPLMGVKNRSHIVNIASMAGFQGSEKYLGLSWYSASKAALACLTECLSVELHDYNIAVNCLALGSVQTEMLSNAFPDYKAPLAASEMAEYIVNFANTGQKVFNGKIIPVALSNP